MLGRLYSFKRVYFRTAGVFSAGTTRHRHNFIHSNLNKLLDTSYHHIIRANKMSEKFLVPVHLAEKYFSKHLSDEVCFSK